MCPKKAPNFCPWQLLKTPPFRPVQLENILLFKKRYFFSSQTPFSRVGQFWSTPPHFSVRGRPPSPLFLKPPWHIYTTFIFEYPPLEKIAIWTLKLVLDSKLVWSRLAKCKTFFQDDLMAIYKTICWKRIAIKRCCLWLIPAKTVWLWHFIQNYLQFTKKYFERETVI